MICSKCKNIGELKSFQTFSYYYCKTCKEEILLEEVPKEIMDPGIDYLREFDRLVEQIDANYPINTDD